jgi:hypothetical protein
VTEDRFTNTPRDAAIYQQHYFGGDAPDAYDDEPDYGPDDWFQAVIDDGPPDEEEP